MPSEYSNHKERLTNVLTLIEKIEKCQQTQRYTEAVVTIDALLVISCKDVQKEYLDLKTKLQKLIQEEIEKKQREEEELLQKKREERLKKITTEIQQYLAAGNYEVVKNSIKDLLELPALAADQRNEYTELNGDVDNIIQKMQQIKEYNSKHQYSETMTSIDEFLQYPYVTPDIAKMYKDLKKRLQKISKDDEEKNQRLALLAKQMEALETEHDLEKLGKEIESVDRLPNITPGNQELLDKYQKDLEAEREARKIKLQHEKVVLLFKQFEEQRDNQNYLKANTTIDEILALSLSKKERKKYLEEKDIIKNQISQDDEKKRSLEAIAQRMLMITQENNIDDLLIQIKRTQQMANIIPEEKEKMANDEAIVLKEKDSRKKRAAEEEIRKEEIKKINTFTKLIHRHLDEQQYPIALTEIDALLSISAITPEMRYEYKKMKMALLEVSTAEEERHLAKDMKKELESLDFNPTNIMESFDANGKKLEKKSTIIRLPVKLGVMIPQGDRFEAKLKNPKKQTAAFISILWNARIPQRIYTLPVTPIKGSWILQSKLVNGNVSWEYEFDVVIETTTTLTVN